MEDTGKPDLFEVGMIELIDTYHRFMKEKGFSWPVISEAADHVIAATKLFKDAING